MESTSVSLLNRLRTSPAESEWERFVDIYAPLIFYWGRQKGLNTDDAADLVQEVLAELVTKLRTFEYQPSLRFRGWLRTVVVNRASNLRRRLDLAPLNGLDEVLQSIHVEDESDLLGESQYRGQVAIRTLQLMNAEFEPTTFKAAWLQIVDHKKPRDVANQLGITINAVYLAKSRVLTRLRSEMDLLLE